MHLKYDDVSQIPTKNFLYGLKEHEETVFEIAPGKAIIVKLLSVGSPNEDGFRTVFFKVNGQTRNVEIQDKNLAVEKVMNAKADSNNENEIGAPLQGLLSKVLVKTGQEVKKNAPLFIIEAMKMETSVTAICDSKVKKITLKEGSMVNTDDLILTLDN
jgi:pyruvate carboxylase